MNPELYMTTNWIQQPSQGKYDQKLMDKWGIEGDQL